MSKSIRVRLKKHEIKALGLETYLHNKYRLKSKPYEKLMALRRENKFKRLFFDIETSPNVVYAWRIGYNLSLQPHDIIEERKIICISYKWEGEENIYSLTWDKNQCDKQMLIDFINIMNQADEIVAHNGDRFDEKWIRTRCIFHRVPAFPKYKSLDTLKKAKYGFNFNSNKLDYIAQFLGVGAKVKHSGFDMWKGVMQNDKKALKEMVHYCEGDIIVLEDVYNAMESYIKPNTHLGVVNGGFKYSCPCCGTEEIELLKNEVTSMGTIKRVIECENKHIYNISNSAYMNYLKFKNI